jgi:hypothetical protein
MVYGDGQKVAAELIQAVKELQWAPTKIHYVLTT